jgi:rod shape-determining protein MreC
LFLALAGVSLILPTQAQQQLSLALRSSALAPFIRAQDALLQARGRAEEAADLQARLDSAVAALLSQNTLKEENRTLRELLELRQRAGPDFLAASAIRPGTRGSESMFLLEVGAAHGVSVNDPVVVASGLIGVVREVSAETSLVMDWTHPEFGVSVMTLDGAAFGFVESLQGAFREEDRLILNGVPFYTPVDVGATLVTSGRGSVYPRGIPVGSVAGLAEADAGWRKSFWVEPAARPAAATHVLVLIASPPGPVQSLEHIWLPEAELPDPDIPADPVGGERESGADPSSGEPERGVDPVPGEPEVGTTP